MIILIAAVSDNGVIAKDGKLPWNIPEDQKAFRYWTSGRIVVMGRKTFESLGKVPLPGRLNIVLTKNRLTEVPGEVIMMHNLEDTLKAFSTIGADLFIVGGGEIYEAALPYADQIFLSNVHQTIEGENLTLFPKFDLAEWNEDARVAGKNSDIPFDFVKLSRKPKAQN